MSDFTRVSFCFAVFSHLFRGSFVVRPQNADFSPRTLSVHNLSVRCRQGPQERKLYPQSLSYSALGCCANLHSMLDVPLAPWNCLKTFCLLNKKRWFFHCALAAAKEMLEDGGKKLQCTQRRQMCRSLLLVSL